MAHIKLLAASLTFVFAISVISHTPCKADPKYHYGVMVKEKQSAQGIDQLFVCTADVPVIFILPPVAYKPARNVAVEKPIRMVIPNSNSPPIFWI